MNIIINDTRKRIINGKEIISVTSFSGLHLISIIVRAKVGESLFINIDDKTFPDHGSFKELIQSPVNFDGEKLKNLTKTVYIAIFLTGKDHTITLDTGTLNGTVTLENITVSNIDNKQLLKIFPNNQAEDGDRRPWITVVLDHLPLTSITSTVTYSRRKRDSDDIKILIDGKNQSSFSKGFKHYLWRYIGSLLPWVASAKTETETFAINVTSGIHVIEFLADRMPVLHDLIIDFGVVPVPFIQPTVDNPTWTGSFYDDSETMLLARAIYGEMGDQSVEAKIAVGWVIRNRVENKGNKWGKTYHDVISQKYQFEPFIDKYSDTFKRITSPSSSNPKEMRAWQESYQIAIKVMSGQIKDPTFGANHFYSEIKGIKIPNWSLKHRPIYQIGITKFYKI